MDSIIPTAVAVVAWIGATFGPITVAILFWQPLYPLRPVWLRHLLFLPSVVAIGWLSLLLLSYATGDDGGGPPGLGFALIPAFAFFPLSIIGYFVALIMTQVTEQRRRTNGS